MQLFTCIVPAAPLRKEAAHRSEMVSQLLFGETAEILEKDKLFARVRCTYDQYEGWCQLTELCAGPEGETVTTEKLTNEWDTVIRFNGQPMHLALGTPLGMAHSGKIGPFTVETNEPGWDPLSAALSSEALAERAFQYLNVPYLWGGRSPFGIDCSGFVQQVYRFFNIALPRDAYLQAGAGETVGFLQEARCGDLAYFDNPEGRITHVGMMLDNATIIHASGRVRVDNIDTMGIISGDSGERTHNLRIIKRYF